jgi:hypothetical protein
MEAVSSFVVVCRSCRVEIAEGVVGENERRRSLVPASLSQFGGAVVLASATAYAWSGINHL